MKQGRPPKSEVRQNIAEILLFMKHGYGYEIFHNYCKIFAPVTMRLIYYHLKKGTDLGIFKIKKIIKEEGDYSWGNQAEKVYYELGPNATAKGVARVREKVASKRD